MPSSRQRLPGVPLLHSRGNSPIGRPLAAAPYHQRNTDRDNENMKFEALRLSKFSAQVPTCPRSALAGTFTVTTIFPASERKVLLINVPSPASAGLHHNATHPVSACVREASPFASASMTPLNCQCTTVFMVPHDILPRTDVVNRFPRTSLNGHPPAFPTGRRVRVESVSDITQLFCPTLYLIVRLQRS